MDLSLVSTGDLIQELMRRLGIEVVVAMDSAAAKQYFEHSDDTEDRTL